jgi:hypothetical protein
VLIILLYCYIVPIMLIAVSLLYCNVNNCSNSKGPSQLPEAQCRVATRSQAPQPVISRNMAPAQSKYCGGGRGKEVDKDAPSHTEISTWKRERTSG